MSAVCQLVPPRYMHGTPPLAGPSNSIDFVTSASDSFEVSIGLSPLLLLALFGLAVSFWGIGCPLKLGALPFVAHTCLSPSSGGLCRLGKWIMGFGCPFECCALAFARVFGRGMYQVDFC